MEKKFWVCEVKNTTRTSKGDSNISLQFIVNCVYLKDAKKHIKDTAGIYPSKNYTVLEVWQKEVK